MDGKPQKEIGQARNSIKKLEKERERQFPALGAATYQAFLAGKIDERGLIEQCRSLQAIDEKIQQVQSRIAELQALARQPVATPVAAAVAGQACPSCGTPVMGGMKFCGNCGREVIQAGTSCPSCGASVAPGIKFCGECGAKIEAAPPAAPAAAAPAPPPPGAPPAPAAPEEPDAKKCGTCGAKLEEEGAAFCGECGSSLMP